MADEELRAACMSNRRTDPPSERWPLPADFVDTLVHKGAYAKHTFADEPVDELRWLWGEVVREVLNPYPFVQKLTFEFALAYDDSWYIPETMLSIDDTWLRFEGEADYIYITPEYAADDLAGPHIPLTSAVLHAEDSFDLERSHGLEMPDTGSGDAAWQAFWTACAKLVDEHYGQYRAPLFRALSLFGALMHDFEEGYFTWLFGYAADVTFTRAGVEVAAHEEYGADYTGPDFDHGYYAGVARMRERGRVARAGEEASE